MDADTVSCEYIREKIEADHSLYFVSLEGVLHMMCDGVIGV
jgi:hypothetical protein